MTTTSLTGATSSPQPPLISIWGVTKTFGATAVLRDIDLDIAKGEVVVVIGPSGSGKSTLCRTINRLETISGGAITFRGEPLPSSGAALKKVRSKSEPADDIPLTPTPMVGAAR
ncbi:ATP-binding cassette domain-containing protein [Nocardia sp. NPDC004278]